MVLAQQGNDSTYFVAMMAHWYYDQYMCWITEEVWLCFQSWEDLFPFHGIQTSTETHSPSYPVDTQDHSPGVKQPVREADNSPPSSAKIKNARSYTSVCQYVFMAVGLFMNRGNFTAFIFSCRQVLYKVSLRI